MGRRPRRPPPPPPEPPPSRAKRIEDMLEEMREANGGILRPEDIWKAVKADGARNPAYDQFTWDETEAAEKCWTEEARALLKRFCRVVVWSSSIKYSVPRYIKNPDAPQDAESGYVPVTSEQIRLQQATSFMHTEIQRCRGAVERARGYAVILDERLGSNLAAEIDQMLMQLLNIEQRMAAE